MPRRFVSALFAGLCLVSASTPALADPPVPKAPAAVLNRIKAADSNLLAVSEEDGRFLRFLVVSSGAKKVLEIGGANGYSAIWIGLGLRETGGRLITIEYDAARAKDAEANIKAAGLAARSRPFRGCLARSTWSSSTPGRRTTSGSSNSCSRASTAAVSSSRTTW
jgi:predicted O-methyltransferase YrrM